MTADNRFSAKAPAVDAVSTEPLRAIIDAEPIMPAVTLVSGSFPPDKCGVGDYTALLLRALLRRGVDAECYHSSEWQLPNLWQHWRRLRRIDHWLLLQHPTAGFDKRLAPFLLWLLLWRQPKAVTLHEFSRKTLLGKLLCYAFFICSQRVIFTTDEEFKHALRFAPWLRHRAHIIPIGSNIPFVATREKTVDVAYFGLIIPGKGLEQFLDLATELAKRRQISLRLSGQIVAGFETFAEDALNRLRALGATLSINADANAVAEGLAESRIVLLPFPDGISPRRGSALAAMGNGALVVTTPPADAANAAAFRELCLLGESPEQLLAHIEAALDDPERYTQMIEASKKYAASFDWNDIADRHVDALASARRAALRTSA